jgi:hypothetical protein
MSFLSVFLLSISLDFVGFQSRPWIHDVDDEVCEAGRAYTHAVFHIYRTNENTRIGHLLESYWSF